jgi:hypothetical protein
VRLYVEPMDAVLVDVDRDGRVRFEHEEWKTPTLQERRAILYAATNQIGELQEIVDLLQDQPQP